MNVSIGLFVLSYAVGFTSFKEFAYSQSFQQSY